MPLMVNSEGNKNRTGEHSKHPRHGFGAQYYSTTLVNKLPCLREYICYQLAQFNYYILAIWIYDNHYKVPLIFGKGDGDFEWGTYFWQVADGGHSLQNLCLLPTTALLVYYAMHVKNRTCLPDVPAQIL